MSYKISSLTGKEWEVQAGQQVPKNSEELLNILAKNRGIEDLNGFINVSVKNQMPHPFVFIDMEKAVNRIVAAVKSKQKIAILGDYDVDGISSVSIFVKFFRAIGVDCNYFIPDRMEDGYGLNSQSINKYKDCLIVAVDCGSNSLNELAYARSIGTDVIVIDHHKMAVISQDAFAVVNPHRPDEKDDFKYLCATGLVFMCVVGLNKVLKESGFYISTTPPDLIQLLDLVALATVCDVVPLVGLNRAFVSTGLKVIRKRENFGIDALLSLSKNEDINSETVSFFLGPRLNAAGRIAHGKISVDLLTSQNPTETQALAKQLDELNAERQAIEHQIIEEAQEKIDEKLNFICCYSADWHVGVIGIVAGRLKEQYNKLSIIISQDSHGVGKASCRSVTGVDISVLINKAIAEGIILSGGGHAVAAGFSIDVAKISQLIEFLKSEVNCENAKSPLTADCILNAADISLDVFDDISVLEPFGASNNRPKFVIERLRPVYSKIVGEQHISVSFKASNGNIIRAIAFKCVGTPLGEILQNFRGEADILGVLTPQAWKGKKYINLQVEDIANSLSD